MNRWNKLKLVGRGLLTDAISSKRSFAYSKPSEVFREAIGTNVAGSYITAEETLAIYTSAKILSGTMAMIPFELRKDNLVYKDSDIYKKLMFRMSKLCNNRDLISALEYERTLYGNAFVDIRKSSNWMMIPHEVVDKWKWEHGNLKYRFNWGKHPDMDEVNKYRTGENIEWVSAEKVLHFKSTSKNGVMGIPMIDVAKHNMEVLNKALETIDSFYSNRAMSPMHLQSELKDSRAGKQFMSDIEDFLAKSFGFRNVGKPLITPPNTKLVQLQTQFQDAQLVETMKFARDEIFNMFGIPSFMYNSSGDLQMDIEQQSLNFKTFTIEPIMSVYEEEFMNKLLSLDDRANGFSVRGNSNVLVDSDITSKANAYGKMIQNAIITPDQASSEMGIPVQDGTDWGEKKYMQKQMYPIEYYKYLIEQESAKGKTDIDVNKEQPKEDADEGDSAE